MEPAEMSIIKNITFLLVTFASMNIVTPLVVEWLKRTFFPASVGRRDYDGKTQLVYVDSEKLEKFLELYTRHISILEQNTAKIAESHMEVRKVKELVEQTSNELHETKALTTQLHQKVVMGH